MQTPSQSTETADTRRRARAEKRAQQQAGVRAAAVLAGNALLRLPEVLAVYPVSSSTWWAGVASGRFPPSVKIGERCTAWRAVDVRALIAGTYTLKGDA